LATDSGHQADHLVDIEIMCYARLMRYVDSNHTGFLVHWGHQNDMVWRHWNDMVSTGTRPTTDVIKAKIKEEHDA
jgi:hypothetical protein